MLTRKLLSFSIKNKRSNILRQWLPIIEQNCFMTIDTSKGTQPSVGTILNYSQEESEKIVNIINNSSIEELAKFPISKAGVKKLESWKVRHGPLRSPEDLLELQGLSVKILKKFCRSLLNDEPKASTTKEAHERHKTISFLIPSLDSQQIRKIRSCVAVYVGVSRVSWSRLEIPEEQSEHHIAPCLLTDWQYHHIADKKVHLDNLVQKCLYFDQIIPAADCYIFENPLTPRVSTKPGNADQQINVEKAQITAMLSFALSARRYSFQREQQEQQKLQNKMTQLEPGTAKIAADKDIVEYEPLPNVFYLRNFLHVRLFHHLIGSERISSEETIANLMSIYENALRTTLTENMTTEQRNLIRGNVQFMQEQHELYFASEGYQRDYLGQALLLNLAFVRLVLLQDVESIKKVTKNQKKTQKDEKLEIKQRIA